MSLPRKHTAILNDVLSVIDHMRANPDLYIVPKENDESEAMNTGEPSRYSLFLRDDDRDHYYSDVAICRFLYYDIARRVNLEAMERYIPGISEIDASMIEKVYYDTENEDFVILARARDYRIYRGDIRYMYPMYCQVSDPIEYDAAYLGDKVYSYSIYGDSPAVQVPNSEEQ